MDPGERAVRVRELRVEILLEVGSDLAHTVKLSSRSTYPTLANTTALKMVIEREGLSWERLLFDDHDETELEKCNGRWRPTMSAIAGPPSERASLDQAAGLFEKHVLPMRTVAKTRSKYWSGWRAVLTWALSLSEGVGVRSAHDTGSLPCVSLGRTIFPVYAAGDTVCVEHHSGQAQAHFKLGSPIGPDGDCSRYMHSLKLFQGSSGGHPFHHDIVVKLLRHPFHHDIVVKLLRLGMPAHSAC